MQDIDWLTVEQISKALNREGIQASPQSNGLVRAAVLVPLLRIENSWHLLFTRRTDKVATHKGQVSFPGGAVDPGDGSEEETALRETFEEIGVRRGSVRILGKMDRLPSVTGFLVTPVVATVIWPVDLILAREEVSRSFHIPLAWLADPNNREERPYIRSNGSSEMVIFYNLFDGELLWGFTGRIVVNFIDLIKKPAD